MNGVLRAAKYIQRSRGQRFGRTVREIAIILQSRRKVGEILRTIDFDQYMIYEEKYNGALTPSIYYGMEFNLRHIYRLGLHHSKPSKVLDIGPGYGYFAYVCKHFGHSVMTIDVDTNPMYGEMCSFLGVSRKIWKVLAYQNLPTFVSKFDLVTAHHVCFDHHDEPLAWGEGEYEYFLRDLRDNHLTEDGKVFLLLNRNNLLRFLARIGAAHADGDRVYFVTNRERLSRLD